MYGGDIFEHIIPIALFHVDAIEADIEFDKYEGNSNPDADVKEEIGEGLKMAAEFLLELEDKGINATALVELLDADVTVEASVGEWQGKAFLRLKNIYKVLLKWISQAKEEKGE